MKYWPCWVSWWLSSWQRRPWCWRSAVLSLELLGWLTEVGKSTAYRQSRLPWIPTLAKPDKQPHKYSSVLTTRCIATTGVFSPLVSDTRFCFELWLDQHYLRLLWLTSCNWFTFDFTVIIRKPSYHSDNNSYSREDSRFPLFIREMRFLYSCHWVPFYCGCQSCKCWPRPLLRNKVKNLILKENHTDQI